MPLPEGYLPRKGDEVLIRARAKRDTDADGEGYFEIIGAEHYKLFMNAEEVHSLYRRQWNEGDLVKSVEFDGRGRVVAVSDDYVWVVAETGLDEGGYYTLEANHLELWEEPIPTITEAELLAGLEPLIAPCDGSPGSQSVVGDDDPISSRDEAANR